VKVQLVFPNEELQVFLFFPRKIEFFFSIPQKRLKKSLKYFIKEGVKMSAVPLFIIGLFIVLGVVFSRGKGSFLIAGYNTLPKEEKEKYDTASLCKFMGKMMFALSFCIVLWVLSDVLKVKWVFTIGLIAFFCVIAFTLFYVNTGNRFKK
jgi:hypothetical protein